MNDLPEVIYPGAELWPPDAPRWATHARTFRVEGNDNMLDLLFTREWSTPSPHEEPDEEQREPFTHLRVIQGWTRRTPDAPWHREATRMEFGEVAPFETEPQRVAATLREIASIFDGTWTP